MASLRLRVVGAAVLAVALVLALVLVVVVSSFSSSEHHALDQRVLDRARAAARAAQGHRRDWGCPARGAGEPIIRRDSVLLLA